MTDFDEGNGKLTNTTKMVQTQQMRTYDELRELDIVETSVSLRYNLSATEKQTSHN